MTNISEKINKQIKDKQLKPKARWNFTVKQVLLWSAIVSTVLIIGLAASLTLEILIEQEVTELWQLKARLYLLLEAIPYFWLMVAFALSVLIYFQFINTKKGYKVRLIFILLGLLIATIVLGIIFYFAGIAEKIEEELEYRIHYYHLLVSTPEKHWTQPEHGLLAGEIMKAKKDELLLMDHQEHEWVIIITEETEIHEVVSLEKGEQIKMRGELEAEDVFYPFMIKPFKRRCPVPGCRMLKEKFIE